MYQNVFVTSRTDFAESMVYLWDDAKGLLVRPYKEFSYAYLPNDRGDFISIYGDKLKRVKVYSGNYNDPNLFESDLPRETRVLTDLYLDSDDPSTGHRICCLDIETDSSNGFSTAEDALAEITAIANYDYSNDQYVVFLLDKDQQLPSSQDGNKIVVSCETEMDLITAWMEWYTKLAPTILTGWNIDGYDIPYLYNRLKRVFGMSMAAKMSPVGLIKYDEYKLRYKLAGVACLDYMALFKKYTPNQKPSYRLDAIAKDVINKGKVEYTGTLHQLYKDDIQKFLDYNLNDVELVVGIDRKLQYIELARLVCHAGHVPYEEFGQSSRFIEGAIITYLHRKGIIAPNKPKGGAETYQIKEDNDEEGFAGAFVRVPMPGLYDWVYSLDLESLYPSLILTLNISPETKFGKVLNWDVERHINKTIDVYNVQIGSNTTHDLSRSELMEFLNTNTLVISSNGILYTRRKPGIIPELLDHWYAERKRLKGEMFRYEKEGNEEQKDYYDRRQYAQKIILNSVYGVLGLPIFRFYDLDNALAVTASGQDVIKSSAKFVNAQYKKFGVAPKTDEWIARYWTVLKEDAHDHKRPAPSKPSNTDHCVYIDTDSIYYSAADIFGEVDNGCERTVSIAQNMERDLNTFYKPMAKMLFNCDVHRLKIKGESVIETALWLAKKRYAMKKVYNLEANVPVVKDKPEVKGIDTVRSGFPIAFGKFMEKMLMDILNKANKSVIDENILKFRQNLKNVEYLKIMKNTSVKNISKWQSDSDSLTEFPSGAGAHVKASLSYNRLLKILNVHHMYEPIRNGDKVKWCYLKNNHYGLRTIAIKTYNDPPEIIELVKNYIHYEKLFEKELEKKLTSCYSALDWGKLPVVVNEVMSNFFLFD